MQISAISNGLSFNGLLRFQCSTGQNISLNTDNICVIKEKSSETTEITTVNKEMFALFFPKEQVDKKFSEAAEAKTKIVDIKA